MPLNSLSLLIVDDDQTLREQLGRIMERKGYSITLASGVTQARYLLTETRFDYAIVDLKLKDGYGLDLVDSIKAGNQEVRIVMLTGYGNIATAVASIKHGAVDYLTKPIDIEAIEQALRQTDPTSPAPPEDPMSPDRVKWEHIHHVFTRCDHNVSETARRLKMHRRTLQRILSKRAPHH